MNARDAVPTSLAGDNRQGSEGETAPGIIQIIDDAPSAMIVELAERVIALTAERDRARAGIAEALCALDDPKGPRTGHAEYILTRTLLDLDPDR